MDSSGAAPRRTCEIVDVICIIISDRLVQCLPGQRAPRHERAVGHSRKGTIARRHLNSCRLDVLPIGSECRRYACCAGWRIGGWSGQPKSKFEGGESEA